MNEARAAAAPGLEAAQSRLCPVCGAAAFKAFCARGLPPGSPAFALRRCPGCGLGWTEPAPSDEEIGSWYPPAYYGKENIRFNPLFEALVRFLHRRRAAAIARRVPPGAVLDVGCGRGFILSHLRAMGYEPHGVELNEVAAWHVRNRLGIDAHVGDLLSAPYGAGSMSAVIFWHSLEHLRRPAAALERARELLKPGGLLVVAVPNSDSLQARLFGADWFHLDIPRHYFHFGRSSLAALLSRLGFEVVETGHFTFEQNPYGWVQSLLNATGFEFNFLYSILKSQTARLIPIKRHPLQAALIAALLPFAVPLALALTLLETALRRGGTIEVYAVKKRLPPS